MNNKDKASVIISGLLIIVAFLSVIFSCTPGRAASYKDMVKMVVAIKVKGVIVGTGITIKKGLVLTAAHICENPIEEVTIYTSKSFEITKKTYPKKHRSDLCLIKAPGVKPFFKVKLPDKKRYQMGSKVLYVGFPNKIFGVRYGTIVDDWIDPIGRGVMLQRINSWAHGGNSGGPVFNMKFELVGIVVQHNMDARRYDTLIVPARYIRSFYKEQGLK